MSGVCVPHEIQNYIKKVIEYSKKICGEHLLSIYLFGGLAKGYFIKGVSDVDLLFIVSDTCPLSIIKKLERTLERLEVKHGLLNINDNFLYFIFASRTAMFKSHFILRLGSFKKMDFQAMFLEGKGFELPLGNFLFPLAPSRLVIRNLLRGRYLLYGHDVIKDVNLPLPSISDFNKSFVVSLSLSMFGIISSLISRVGTKFSLEGFKWYILNAFSILENQTPYVPSAIKYIRLKCPPLSLFVVERFEKLRKKCCQDIIFCFIAPLCLLILHIILLKCFRKALK